MTAEASSLTSFPLHPCTTRHRVSCQEQYYGKGTENAAGTAGQDMKWQIKWLGISTKLLHTLRYTLGIITQYPEKLWYLATFWN